MLQHALRRLHHQLGTHLHQPVVQIPCRILRTDAHLVAEDDSAGVDVLVYHERCHAGNTLPVDHRPVDRSGTAILRQKGGVKIERAELRHPPDLLRQHAERHHHEEIRLPRSQLRQELGILELDRLKHGQAMLHRIFLDGTLVHLQPAATGLVGNRHHAHHLVFSLHQSIQGSHRELGRAHEYYALRAEETADAALELAPVVHQRIVAEESGILDCPRSQICSDRGEHQSGYEGAQRRAYGPVPGQFDAGDVHHPVEHEEQHRDNGADSERALADERSQRGSDEE